MAEQMSPEVAQMLHSLEQRYVKLRDEHLKVKTQRDELLSKDASLEQQLAEEQRQMRAARASAASLEAAALDQKRFLQRTQAELTAAHEDLERSRREAERLSGLMTERYAAADDAGARLAALQKELFDLQAKQVPLEFDRDKLTREKEALATQNAWLDKELEDKAAELRALKHSHASEAASLRTKADEMAAEVASVKEALARARESNDERSASLEKAQAEVAQCRTEAAAARSDFEGQVGAEQRAGRLATELQLLAEAALKQREHDLEGLRDACREAEAAWNEERQQLQGELEQRTSEAHAVLEAKQNANDELTSKLQASERQVVGLTQQQSQLQLQLQQQPHGGAGGVLALSLSTTTAAAAVDGGAAAGGGGNNGVLTVMEVFGQLQEKDAAWRAEKAERQRLEVNLDAILKELEKKAPILESQRRDYKRALAAHNRLSEKLEQALRAEQQLSSAAEQASARAEACEKETAQLKQQNSDLSRQVQHLLRAQVDRSLGTSSSSSSALAIRQNTPTRGGGGFGATPLTPQQQKQQQLSGSVLSPHDVVSENLVVVNDVDDMQRNNMYLIATVRALTEDLEKVSSASAGGGAAASGGPLLLKGPGGGDSDDVAALLAEVSEMRKARQRQEEMVETIVKQRDMYRLAAQTVAAVGDGGGSAMGDNSLALSSPNMSPQQKQQQQQHQLSPGAAGVAAAEERFAAVEHGLRDTVVELERRLARAEEERGIFKQLKEQLAGDERLAAERAATARGEAEREGAQARFLEGQVERLQQDLAGSQREADLLRQRGDKGAATAEAQERSLAEREASVVELTDKWRRAEAKVGSLEQAKAIAEASEQRFKDDNVRLRTEMKQTSGLVDSMQRIESGLSASKAAEAEGLALERDKLREALEQARQDASDAEVRQEQARAAALAEVRQERRKADAANEALAAAKEAASEADQAVAAAKAKAEALQAHLEEVHERSERREATLRGFASVAGGGGAAAGGGDEGESEGSGLSAALAALEAYELKSKQMAVDLEAARAASEAADERAKVYQSLAESNERAVSDMAAAASSQQAELSRQLGEVTAERDRLSAEGLAQSTRLRELELEANQKEDEASAALAALKKKAAEATAQVRELEAAAAASAGREKTLSSELEAHRLATGRAQANYERELQLHAEANAKVRAAEAALVQERGAQADLGQRAAALQAQLVEREAGWSGEKRALEAAREAAIARAEELGVTNGLLHAEVQRLGSEVDRVQESRLGDALGTTTTTAAAAGGAGAAAASTDQALAGLRRVLLGVRKEKDLLEAKMSAATHQASIKEQLAHHLRRELDEARAELKAHHEQANLGAEGDSSGGGGSGAAALAAGFDGDSNVGGGPKGAHAKLVAQLEENNLIRESNAMLRGEANRLTAKLKEAEQKAATLEDELAPLQSALRQCEADKAAVTSEVQELTVTVATWKTRVETLTRQYKLVDPEDHARVTADLASARAALDATKASLEASTQHSAAEKEALGAGLRAELEAEQVKAREVQQKASAAAAEAAATAAQLVSELGEAQGLGVQRQRALDSAQKELRETLAAHAQEMAMMQEKYENVRVNARGIMEKKKEQSEVLEKEITQLKIQLTSALVAAKAPAAPTTGSDAAPAATPALSAASSSSSLSTSSVAATAAAAAAATPASPPVVRATGSGKAAAPRASPKAAAVAASPKPPAKASAPAAAAGTAADTGATSAPAPPAAPAEAKSPVRTQAALAKKPVAKLSAKPTPPKTSTGAAAAPFAAAASSAAAAATPAAVASPAQAKPTAAAAAGAAAGAKTGAAAAPPPALAEQGLRAKLLANKRPAPTGTTPPVTAEAKSPGAPPAGARGAKAKPGSAAAKQSFKPTSAAAAPPPAAAAPSSPTTTTQEAEGGPAAKKPKPSAFTPAAAEAKSHFAGLSASASPFSFASPVGAKATTPGATPTSEGTGDALGSAAESEVDKKAKRMARFVAAQDSAGAAPAESQKRPSAAADDESPADDQPAQKKPAADVDGE